MIDVSCDVYLNAVKLWLLAHIYIYANRVIKINEILCKTRHNHLKHSAGMSFDVSFQ